MDLVAMKSGKIIRAGLDVLEYEKLSLKRYSRPIHLKLFNIY
jgi:phosphoglycerate dehydrogenase-like enzyme